MIELPEDANLAASVLVYLDDPARAKAGLRLLPDGDAAPALAEVVTDAEQAGWQHLGTWLQTTKGGAARVEVRSEGIDIVLALDVSGSMRAEDFEPDNRLGVAKKVARNFVAGRSGDRIGLVVFAGGAYTQCPITLDYGMVQSLLDEVAFGRIPDGTAIGLALAAAAARLKASAAETRVAVLLTDGVNNAGAVDRDIVVVASAAVVSPRATIFTKGAT